MGTVLKAQKLIKEANIIDAKHQSDTIRLWENFRDQAILWRSMALIQIPTTLVMAVFCMYMWGTRRITLNVPAKPLPGIYTAQEIPDSEFIDVSTAFVNLIGTYQPAIARRQFNRAREMLQEPMLERFNRDWMITELKTIENTSRTQIFFADPTKTHIFRRGKTVEVSINGDRLKMIAGRELPPIITIYSITMTTIPRNDLNPYGIVISNVASENVTPDNE